MIVEFIILLGLALFIFYKWSTANFDFFEKIGIPYDKPFPLFGSQKDIVLRKTSMYDNVNRLYKQFNTSVFGIFDQRTPIYVIRDPALIKQITVKEFDHFINHRTVFDDRDGGLFGNSLFVMRNDKWKDMRSTVSPVFTGSKMRQMFVLMNEVAKESMDFLKINSKIENEIDLNIKDYFTRFTNDTIASAVFGLKVNSFKDDQNEFYQMGKRVTKFTALQNLKFFLFFNFKYIMRLLKIELFNKKDTNYFLRLVLDAMKYREQNKIIRPDMVNMMMEAKGIFINKEPDQKPTTDKKWTDDEIVAQFFLFFFAGFETTAVMMAFTAIELMQNRDCQDKLRQEIFDVKEALDRKPLSYEALQGMKYMDMVISETLRRWPPAVSTDRQCNKDFSYKDNDVDITIKSGETIWIPIVGYHMDEKYFPDPLKFDPERFSEENKADIQPFTYLPFGVGPRNCIGNRFALLEAKAILFYILSEFRIEPSPKSTIPTVLSSAGFNLEPKGGFWVKLVPLENYIFGIFDQRNPVFGIRDPALVKQILVKDFDHFINHREVFNENFGGLFGISLFFMRNDKWKNMRNTLSPVFTGSKMRQMFGLINEVAKESMDFLKNKSKTKKEIDFNIKDYFTKFTNDTIASTVFGLKINSFQDENNTFYQMGKRVTTPTLLQNIKFYLYLNLKYITELLNIQMFDQADTDYFQNLVLDTMKYREMNKIFRPDMVHMLMEAKGIFMKNEEQQNSITGTQWTDEEIVAQFFLFLFAGFEITATMMSFAANELMQNPDCQDKLRQEIFDVKKALDGKPLNYEVLQGMKYMDMVMSETLRRWPPTVITFRQCNKNFSYKDNDVDVTIKSGQTVCIPIVGFHMDEQYFPNPHKFDPERFSDENIGNIKPFTYMPFGGGPRICIGKRFALLEGKAILFYILSEFRIEPSLQSTIPTVLAFAGFNLVAKGGSWMKLVPLKTVSYVSGLFDQRIPTFIIRDPDLLKRITIKDFDHFINHRTVFSEKDGGLFGNALSNMHNEKWKSMRSTLSPVFTGSKMRQMFVLINEVAHESMRFLKKDGKTEIDFNIKDYFTHFTNDVIASAVFGLQINSFQDEDNEFYAMGKKVTKFSAWQNLKFILFTNFKYIMRAFKITLFDVKYTSYFTRLVMDAMKYRQEHKIVRPDMINMMMEAKGMYIDKEPDQKPLLAREWSDDEIVAQFFVFFFAGFEPTSVLMSFASHELMVNPDVQERLREEILDVKDNLNGKPLTYEVLQGMKYMDMVVSETLRRWPPAVVTDRECNKDFHYKDDEIDVTIKVGQHLWIPIVGYHLDENYFPEPMKFDPERFSDENKGNIQPFTYLPFGVGPRNCIANRFALMEAKAMLFYLVGEFEIKPSAKSTIPMVLDKGTLNPAPKNGFWSKLIPLKS